MNWEAIKYIYRCVLIYKDKFEYLGGDKYRLISFYPTGEKHWETEYQNGQPHGKYREYRYKNGKLLKNMSWNENGHKCWNKEY